MSKESKTEFRVIREKGVAKLGVSWQVSPSLWDHLLWGLPSLRGHMLRRMPDSFLWGPVDRWTSEECETNGNEMMTIE